MKVIIVLFAMFLSCTGTSQKVGVENLNKSKVVKVIYEESKDVTAQLAMIPDPELKKQLIAKLAKPVNYELIFSSEESLYRKKKEDGGTGTNINGVQVISMKTESMIYKNRKSYKLITKNKFMGKNFLINSELQKYEWEILGDTKTIGEYHCTKAKTITEDGEVFCYFTTEIPTMEGPKGYGGLPGLILYLEKGDKTIKAVQFEYLDNFNFEVPTKGKIVTKEEYEKLKTDAVENLQNSFNG